MSCLDICNTVRLNPSVETGSIITNITSDPNRDFPDAPQSNTILRFAPTASGTGNGDSWANARVLTAATINAVTSGTEVWIKEGTYTFNNVVVLNYGVSLYGGFKGTETSRSERTNVNVNVLTLGTVLKTIWDMTIYRIVGSGIGIGMIRFDGIAFTGIGTDILYCQSPNFFSFVMKNCRMFDFINPNGRGFISIDDIPGGIPVSVTIVNSLFEGADRPQALFWFGFGAFSDDLIESNMTGCVVRNNKADFYGAVMYNVEAAFVNCIFDNNDIPGDTFAHYTNLDSEAMSMTNCTIIGTGTGTNGIQNSAPGGTIVVTNSIIQGFSNQAFKGSNLMMDTAINCILQSNNLSSNIALVNTSNNAGAVTSFGPTYIPLTWTTAISPINSGNNSFLAATTFHPNITVDVYGNPRIVNVIVDKGAVEVSPDGTFFSLLLKVENCSNSPIDDVSISLDLQNSVMVDCDFVDINLPVVINTSTGKNNAQYWDGNIQKGILSRPTILYPGTHYFSVSFSVGKQSVQLINPIWSVSGNIECIPVHLSSMAAVGCLPDQDYFP